MGFPPWPRSRQESRPWQRFRGIEYKLHPVFVSSVQQSGGADESSESASLTFGAINQTIGNPSQFGRANAG